MNTSNAAGPLLAALGALLVAGAVAATFLGPLHGYFAGGGMMQGGMMNGGMMHGGSMGGSLGAPDAAPVNTTAVEMRDSRFVPTVISIRPGETVTWTNRDSYAHTVTSDDTGGPLDSPSLSAGASWTFTFPEAGTFLYHCVPHAYRDASGAYVGMTAKVVVQ